MNLKIKLKKYAFAVVALASVVANAQAQDISSLKESDYSVPSWTNFRIAYNKLQSANMPYGINMVVNGDPQTRIAFNWFTNPTTDGGKVQIVAKAGATDADFSKADIITVNANIKNASLNYYSSKNQEEIDKTGCKVGDKRSYTSHKALATGLMPATVYSYRVGDDGAWSNIGTFKTATIGKDAFSFIYITDTQANTADMFDVTQKTVHRALTDVSDADFLLCNGDFVESSGDKNSEWEWEQWFSTMQDCWMKLPIVPIQGNHDTSSNNNFTLHFNTDTTYNERVGVVSTTMNGTVYSFVKGDALFMVVNYEDWNKDGYFDSLTKWMREQVALYPNTKWRIATYHKCMFTGSQSHQDDADEVAERNAMLPVYDELKIDLALQGHDHIYEVIGPVKSSSKTLIDGSVEDQEIVAGGVRENMTGKEGGVYNVNGGTLYFLNNSAGKKKYEPRDENAMTAAYSKHLVNNYWGLFSGKFGQTGDPTFSKVTVSTDGINIVTYTVDGNGNASKFDSFKVIKGSSATDISSGKTQTVRIAADKSGKITVYGVNPEKIEVYGLDGMLFKSVASASSIDATTLAQGNYIVKATSDGHIYTVKISL